MVGRTNTGGGVGGSGGTLTVTGIAGHTVTATKDGKTYTRTINSNGVAVFKGLSTGTWTLTMTGDGQTATRTVEVNADYAVTITYFSATINVTYPSGSTCKATHTDGTVLNAPDTSGTWACVVPKSGTWTILAEDTSAGKSKSVDVSITADGQSKSVTLSYSLMLYNAGDECTNVTGGWVADAKGSSTGGWNPVKPTLTKNSDSMTVAMPTYEGNGCVRMTKSVDMSEYTTLKATISDFSGALNTDGHEYISIYKQGANPFDGYAVHKKITKADTFSLAVDSLNEEYNVAFGCANNGTTTQYTITKVWLE